MAGKTIDREYEASPQRLFEACRRAVGELGYTILFSDSNGFSISFNTGRSMKSWGGQDLTATIFESGDKSTLVIGGSIAQTGNPFGGNQIGSWGEKSALSNKFHDTVSQILPSIPEKSTSVNSGGIADEIAKLKALLDQGVITIDEFEAGKQKLLG